MRENSRVYHIVSLGIGIIIYTGVYFSNLNSWTVALLDILAAFLIIGGLVCFLQRMESILTSLWEKIRKRTP